jgi:hypothetical protein
MVGNKNLDVAALGRCSHFGLLARHTAPLAICTTGRAVRLLAIFRERHADSLAGFGSPQARRIVTMRLPSRLNAACRRSSSRAKTPR